MKNTQRHEKCCTSHPPSTGPMAAVIPVKPDHVPIALPRSAAGKCRADDRQTSRHKQSAAHSLQSARQDQMANVRGEAAPGGCGGKEGNANDEYETASVKVARCAAQQDERRQK